MEPALVGYGVEKVPKTKWVAAIVWRTPPLSGETLGTARTFSRVQDCFKLHLMFPILVVSIPSARADNSTPRNRRSRAVIKRNLIL